MQASSAACYPPWCERPLSVSGEPVVAAENLIIRPAASHVTLIQLDDLDAAALENLNREFRRRTKKQATFGTEAAAVSLLYGLGGFGQIMFGCSDGPEELSALRAKESSQAAC